MHGRFGPDRSSAKHFTPVWLFVLSLSYKVRAYTIRPLALLAVVNVVFEFDCSTV